MTPARASAPGKVILFGEHAVVYGQPALAVPVARVQATATVTPQTDGAAEIWIDAQDLGRRYRLAEAAAQDPLAVAVRLGLERFGAAPAGFTLTLQSTIPIASGLGSGAAVSTAIVRALAAALGQTPDAAAVSGLVYETEKLLHGTPSGVDNTVIAYGQPVFFVRGQPPEPFRVAAPFQLLIADTGLASPTKITVGDVRAGWQREPARFDALFTAIGALVRAARAHLEAGQPEALGPLLARNHAYLRELGVSCRELDALVDAAQAAGALGAKLSGGGRGGNLIALVTAATAAPVEAALREAGAVRVLSTSVGMPAEPQTPETGP